MTQEKVFISTDEIPTMKLVHSDERRDLREVVIPQVDGTVVRVGELTVKSAATAEDPVVLGNHYHDKKERFALVSGDADVTLADHDDPTSVTGHEYKEGEFLTVEAGVTHAFTYKKPGVLKTTSLFTFEDQGTHQQKIS